MVMRGMLATWGCRDRLFAGFGDIKRGSKVKVLSESSQNCSDYLFLFFIIYIYTYQSSIDDAS